MTPEQTGETAGPCVSIGIFAWNEERALATTLLSLFQQSLFAELCKRSATCEVICVANGCTDNTPLVATEVLDVQQRFHPYTETFSARVADLTERGKVNAWNQFVHSLSAKSARYLVMMDADILIHRPETLWSMVVALEKDGQAHVAVDRPCKHTAFKKRKSLRDLLALSASQATQSAAAQLCGQLYCMRAEVARNIYLPKDLAACEDGFIKALVCSDFLEHEIWPVRIRVAEHAEHTFEAYTSPAAILRNQKRQIIGQTIVHVLVDEYLKTLPSAERLRLADTLRAKEREDPFWLKRLIRQHLERTRFCWQLYPGLVGHRLGRLRQLGWLKRVTGFPGAAAASSFVLLASWLAHRLLRRGSTDYWPPAQRAGLAGASP